jgi:hypothetical protein
VLTATAFQPPPIDTTSSSPPPSGTGPSISEVATVPSGFAGPSTKPGNKKKQRQLDNWITSYLEYTHDIPAPPSFHLWSGLTAISGALSRRIWIRTSPRMPCLFPNLFTFLVARPGLGKDLAINTAADILREADRTAREAGSAVIRLGGESVSHKGLYDKLGQEASKLHLKWTENGEHHAAAVHSLMFCIGELGTVLPEYDTKLIPLLNELFNCKPSLEDSIRGQEVYIENPHLVLLLGNQPQTLSEVISERHFRMGFTARVIFIYENDECPIDMYVKHATAPDDKLRKALIGDLMEISKLSGPFRVSPEVMDLANEFKRTKPMEVPGPRFVDYNTRRALHLHKLSLILAASEGGVVAGGHHSIEASHWIQSREFLLMAEAQMPRMFDQVTSSRGFSDDFNEAAQEISARGRPIPLMEIISQLGRGRPPHEVQNITRLLLSTGQVKYATHPDGRLVVPHSLEARHA